MFSNGESPEGSIYVIPTSMVREMIDVVDLIVGKTGKEFVRALESCSG
jgi:hypothetical protein